MTKLMYRFLSDSSVEESALLIVHGAKCPEEKSKEKRMHAEMQTLIPSRSPHQDDRLRRRSDILVIVMMLK